VRIGLDLSVTKVNQAGTGIYASNLARALGGLKSPHQYEIFSLDQTRNMSAPKTLGSRLQTIYRDLVWMHMILPYRVKRAKADLLHMPFGIMPYRTPCPTVVTIFDTTICTTPGNFSFWHRNYAGRFMPLAARNAARIITISAQSKLDIIRDFGVAPDNVVVTQLAASAHFAPLPGAAGADLRARYGLGDQPIIVTVGTLEPRKNLVRLLQSFARLRAAFPTCMLVHAGPRGWHFADVLAEVEALGLQQAVSFLGRVPLDDLVRLYNASALFVYPSLYEGFGLPVLEAMASGCPVVTSNISSLPEVAGDAAIMVDPTSVDAIADAMAQVLGDAGLGADLRRRGLERAGMFSWERCAQETQAVYEQAHGA
jgi:glycosyltransferase involved in cell wall biosynthesis